ncbi:MAG TPA: hypothetical protein VIV40_01930 [Kofleriaceae bacterium]
MRALTSLVFACSVVAACGPGHRGDDDGNGSGSGSGSGSDGPVVATLTGKVWAPKWAPGDVPPGQEIPIFGATIYVTDTRPQPIPQQTYCEPCVDTPQGSVASKHDGSFELPLTGTGHYWLVIQKGPFRLEQEIDVAKGTTALAPQNTTLPSKHDPAVGAWIPKIAIVRGNYDAIEDILGKIGFGSMSGNKLGTPDGEITFYDWGGTGNTSAEYLVQNISELRKYHIVFFPCSTSVNDTVMNDQNNLKNIRQFVADGGKLYVTDWSGEVGDRAFPPQIQLGSSGFGSTDTVGTYDPIALTGAITTAGDADGDLYDSEDGKAVDPDLSMWLGLQTGPSESNPVPSLYNPNAFQVHHNWNWITKLNSVMKGTDDMGQPVYDDPKGWVTASDTSGHGAKPVAVTYEPTGCGKVLYSTFQTSGASASESHMGLMAQERVLLFLIMEISACTQNPVIL